MLEVRTTRSRRRSLCSPEDREGGLPRRFCKYVSRPTHAAPAMTTSGLHFHTSETFRNRAFLSGLRPFGLEIVLLCEAAPPPRPLAPPFHLLATPDGVLSFDLRCF